MLTEKKMLEIAEKHVAEMVEISGIDFIIIHKAIIKKSYGNIFSYTSKKYYETKDFKYAVAGNSPFLVENKSGNIITFGTGETKEYYIAEYEAGRWPAE